MLLSAVAMLIRTAASVLVIAVFTQVLPLNVFVDLASGLFIGQIAAICIDGGINLELLRSVANEGKDKQDARVLESMLVRTSLGSILAVVLCVGYALFADVWAALTVALAALSVVLGNVVDTYFVNLRATGQYRQEFNASLVASALMIFTPLICVLNPLMAGVGAVLPRVVSLLVFQRYSTATLKIGSPVRFVTRYYTRIISYTTDSIASNINARLDSVAIWFLLGAATYAQYQPTARLLYAGLALASFVGGISIPRATKMQLPKARLFLLVTFSSAGLVIAAGLLFGLMFVSEHLFGEHFKPSTSIALLVAAALAARYLAAGAGSYLTIAGRQHWRAMITITATLATIGITLLLPWELSVVLSVQVAAQLLIGIIYLWAGYREKAI